MQQNSFSNCLRSDASKLILPVTTQGTCWIWLRWLKIAKQHDTRSNSREFQKFDHHNQLENPASLMDSSHLSWPSMSTKILKSCAGRTSLTLNSPKVIGTWRSPTWHLTVASIQTAGGGEILCKGNIPTHPQLIIPWSGGKVPIDPSHLHISIRCVTKIPMLGLSHFCLNGQLKKSPVHTDVLKLSEKMVPLEMEERNQPTNVVPTFTKTCTAYEFESSVIKKWKKDYWDKCPGLPVWQSQLILPKFDVKDQPLGFANGEDFTVNKLLNAVLIMIPIDEPISCFLPGSFVRFVYPKNFA